MNVVGLLGSPSLWSRSSFLAERLGRALAAEAGARVETLTLRDLPAQALLQGHAPRGPLAQAVRLVQQADVVLLATTVERGSYSGLLKAFLEFLPDAALRGKTVVPIVTGSKPDPLRSLDAALAPVLQSLGARRVLGAVFATHPELLPHPTRGYVAEPQVLRQLDNAVQALVNPVTSVAAPSAPRIRLQAFAC